MMDPPTAPLQIRNKCLTKLFRTVLFSNVRARSASPDTHARHDAWALFNYRDAE